MCIDPIATRFLRTWHCHIHLGIAATFDWELLEAPVETLYENHIETEVPGKVVALTRSPSWYLTEKKKPFHIRSFCLRLQRFTVQECWLQLQTILLKILNIV